MKVLFEKWWDNNSKTFGIINYKKSWKENGIKPKISYHTNGAKRTMGDKCFDATLTIGYTVFNYTNWDLQKEWSDQNAR